MKTEDLNTRDQNQKDQLALIRRDLQPITELEEIDSDMLFYLKNDIKKNHWVWTRIKFSFMTKNYELIFEMPDGSKRPFTSGQLELIYTPKSRI